MEPDPDTCYRAVVARDSRFDGRVFTAVTTTGIYCRPSCPSRLPLRHNVRFYSSAAAAAASGFRACKRCRPDALPGSRAWDHRGDLVARALRLIAAGEIDERGVAGLASRLSVSERHLHRSVVAEVGVGPLALARTRRAQTARLLIDQTSLTMTDVAFAAGFSSVRQFNDVMREEFAVVPSALRRPGGTARRGTARERAGGQLVLRLVHREPYHAAGIFGFLSVRAVGGVEAAGPTSYSRVVATAHGPSVVTLAPCAGHLVARLSIPDLGDLGVVVAKLRSVFDLDADPGAVDDVLAGDPLLSPLVAARPGMRVPGAVDGFEIAVRAVLGQQVSVAGARTLAVRLCGALGEQLVEPEGSLTHAFPVAGAVADADLDGLGLTGGRVRALRGLATEVAAGRLELGPGADRVAARAGLLAVPGIGPWTAGYVAMRALRDPDGWPDADLVLRRWAAARAADPNGWRPWRAYAAMHLWADSGGPATPIAAAPTTSPAAKDVR